MFRPQKKHRSDFHIHNNLHVSELKCFYVLLRFFMFYQLCVAYTPPYTHQRYINADKIVPNTDNLMIFTTLDFYNFTLVTDTTVQNNDNEISLHFKPMRLIFMNYSV